MDIFWAAISIGVFLYGIYEISKLWLKNKLKIEDKKAQALIEVENIKAKNKLEIEKLYLERKEEGHNSILKNDSTLDEKVNLDNELNKYKTESSNKLQKND